MRLLAWEHKPFHIRDFAGRFDSFLDDIPSKLISNYQTDPIVKIKIQKVNTKTISKELKVEYDKLYPLISEKAEKANLTFFDLTDIYDKCEICYIDFCHVSPNGNKILVTKLIDIFTEKKIL